MIELKGKVYRNLQEQVEQNSNDIEELKNTTIKGYTKEEADEKFLSKEVATETYLSKEDAENDYQEKINADTILTLDSITVTNKAEFNEVELAEVPTVSYDYNKAGIYLIYVGDDNDTIYGVLGITYCDLGDYSRDDLIHALDFDKPSQTNYDQKDLEILKKITEGMTKSMTRENIPLYFSNGTQAFRIYKNTGLDTIIIESFEISSADTIFKLEFDATSLIITNYYNTGGTYIYLDLVPIYLGIKE